MKKLIFIVEKLIFSSVESHVAMPENVEKIERENLSPNFSCG
jgi:hypothetical protein